MSLNRRVVVELVSDVRKFNRGMQNAATQTGVLSGSLGKVAVAGAGVAAVGGAIAVGLGKGVADSIKAFANFDAKMNESLAIMGNVSDSLRDEMSDAAREVALSTSFSAEEAAESYFFLASAGLDAEQSIAALPQVAAFAQAGMFDMATATDLATDAQSALGLTSDDAAENLAGLTKVTDVLVKSNTLANTSVQQVSEALTNKLGAALRAANIPMEEGVAVLAAYADQGLKGAAAGEALGIALRDLKRAATENGEAFEEVGIEVFDSQGNFRNLADVVGDVETAFGDLSVQEQTLLAESLGFQDRSFKNIQLLFGQAEAIREYEAGLRDAAGTTGEIADNQMQTLNEQFGLLGDRIQDAKIELGEELGPAMEDLIPQLEVLIETGKQIAITMGPSLAAGLEFGIRALEGIAETGLRAMELFGNTAAGDAADLIEVMSAIRRETIAGETPVDRLAQALLGLETRASLTEENMWAVVGALGASEDQLLMVLPRLREHIAATGTSTEAIDGWIASLQGSVDPTQEVYRWTQRFGGAVEESGDATDDAIDPTEDYGDEIATLEENLRAAHDAQESLADLLKGLADPVFKAQSSMEKYRDTLKKVDEDGERTADEQLELAGALLELQGDLDALNPRQLEDAMFSIATALGTSTEEVEKLLIELGILDEAGDVVVAVDIDYRGLTDAEIAEIERLQRLGGGTVTSTFTDPFSSEGRVSGRQFGGRVEADRPYIVGEKRPELFIPDRAGEIVPDLGMLGGSVTETYHQNIELVSTGDTAMDAQMAALILGNRARVRSGLRGGAR